MNAANDVVPLTDSLSLQFVPRPSARRWPESADLPDSTASAAHRGPPTVPITAVTGAQPAEDRPDPHQEGLGRPSGARRNNPPRGVVGPGRAPSARRSPRARRSRSECPRPSASHPRPGAGPDGTSSTSRRQDEDGAPLDQLTTEAAGVDVGATGLQPHDVASRCHVIRRPRSARCAATVPRSPTPEHRSRALRPTSLEAVAALGRSACPTRAPWRCRRRDTPAPAMR